MELGTILGVVSLGVKVISLADTVIGTFDRVQNAPQELRDFRQAAVRLQRHLEFLQADVGDSLDFLHEEDVHEVQDTLTLCEELLQKQVDLQNGGMMTGVIRGVWTLRNNQRLIRYKARIDNHYAQILVPGWLQTISARNAAANNPSPLDQRRTSTSYASSVNSGGPSISNEQLQAISEKLRTLKHAEQREDIEQQLRTIDYELQTCWAELGLFDEEIIEYPIPTIPRRSSLNFEYAPTTLILQTAPDPHKRIRLERLHIMARDDESRILQYQNHDATIHVTHIVPYGSIPWTRNATSHKVSFLTPHMITVIDSDGYHVYKIDPKYKFDDHLTCERFQSTLRERAFCGAFEAVEIKIGRRIVSCRQMIRFWQRAESNANQLNTMTFLLTSVDTSRPGYHEEVDLFELQASVELCTNWKLGRRVENGSVDLQPSFHGTRRFHIKFESVQDARNFKERYEALRNGQQIATPALITTTPSLRAGSVSTATTFPPTPRISVTEAPQPMNLPPPAMESDHGVWGDLEDWRSVLETINGTK